jgi:copper oxidase (laccase) domain-containing protein
MTFHKVKVNAYKTSAETLHGQKPHGLPGHRWKDNIKIDIRGKAYKRLDRTGLHILRISSHDDFCDHESFGVHRRK